MWRPPVIIAHRGVHSRYPENSLPAFVAGWRSGFDWCECDVHLTADSVPVVIHDETLERTTTGRGRVDAFTFAELSRVRLLAHDGLPTDKSIPSLDQVFDEMPEGCQLLIETKPRLGERIFPIAERIFQRGGGLQSFQIDDVELALSQFGDQLKCAGLAENMEQVRKSIRRWNLDYRALDAAKVQRLRKDRILVGAWTPNDDVDLWRLVSLGIDAIITDEPDTTQRIIMDSFESS
jgi:glycerophosphoryl diester phosphodiesterase